MNRLSKDGVTLAYQEKGTGTQSILFLHGLGFDHTTFTSQMEYFGQFHRVIAMDLRGHGASDAPYQDYTMPAFADDVAWLSKQLSLKKPIVVGHSMGGNTALTLASLYPDLPSSIILIDSLLFPLPPMLEMLKELAEMFQGARFSEARAQLHPLFFLPTDDAAVKAEMFAVFLKAPQHVLHSGLLHHTILYDAASFAAGCRVPVAYIAAAKPLADLTALREAIPQVITAQTLGSGHFSPAIVPDQINAMIARFLTVYCQAAS